MRVLITGSTGLIGSAFLRHCILHPSITSIATLTRRPVQPISSKVTNIVVTDWENWDASILVQIADADAVIWALGTSNGDVKANLDYPVAFHQAFLRTIRAVTAESDEFGRRKRFRYIHLSGALVERDQSRTLFFLPQPRKIKGLAETFTLNFAKTHNDVWQSWILRPGGVMAGGDTAWNRTLEVLGGRNMFIRDDELGAFVADLVVRGEEAESEGVVGCERMVGRGREILELL